jgi:SAM-dependent methyltransferase
MLSPAYEPAHCIICGHQDSELVADDEAISREVEALWEFHGRRLKAGTPIARLRDRVAFSQHPPFRLVACRECGLVYRNPAERTFEVNEAYAGDNPSEDVMRALHSAQRDHYRAQARRLRRWLSPGASVLEVGSYVGAFLSAAREAKLNAIGVDINPVMNDFARGLGFRVHDSDLAGAPETRVDAVAIWNTFDQLAEPRGAVMAARSRLRPGGILAIRVPNGRFYGDWRKANGARGRVSRMMLAHNNLLSFPYRWGFTPESLKRLVDEAGFDEVEIVGDVLVPTADCWTHPWARAEERLVKGALKTIGGLAGAEPPWFEIYARAARFPV